jgi:hypothetical protein
MQNFDRLACVTGSLVEYVIAREVWYCPHTSCKYPRGESKVSKRKDHFDRHVQAMHEETV